MAGIDGEATGATTPGIPDASLGKEVLIPATLSQTRARQTVEQWRDATILPANSAWRHMMQHFQPSCGGQAGRLWLYVSASKLA